MNPLLFSLAAVAFKGTAILGVAWLLHLALRNAHPALRIALWRVVALSLIALPVVDIFAPRWNSPTLAPALAPIAEASRSFAFEPALPPSSVAPAQVTAMPAANPGRPIPFAMIFVGIWVLGVVVIAARQLRAHTQLRRLLKSARPAPELAVQRADAIARKLGRPLAFELRVIPDGNSPLIAGLGRAVIAIPEGLLESPRELDAVLAHELTHRAGSDHRWASVAQVTRALWWPHPLVWGISGAHRAACEENSDAAAAMFDGDAAWYSSMLAKLALASAGARPTPAMSMMSGSEIMDRLRRLAERRATTPPRASTSVLLSAAVVAFAMVCGTMGIAPERAAAQPQPSSIEAKPPAATPTESTPSDTVGAEKNWALPPPDAALVEKLSVRGDLAARQALVPEILALLESDDPNTRAVGISVLRATASIKFDRSPLRDALRHCLSDENPEVQISAFHTLAVAGGGREDLEAIMRLADSKDPHLLEAIGNGVFYFDPKNEDPKRDQIVLKLMNNESEFVQREVLRGSWGYAVSEPVEARMIEISRRPSMTHNAVYFGLSTRPVKSVAVATRLIEVMRTEKDWNTTYRAVWGLANWDAVPEAHALILDALIEQFDESTDVQGMSFIVHHLGMRMCAFERAKAKLQQIAADDSIDDSLRNAAKESLARGC